MKSRTTLFVCLLFLTFFTMSTSIFAENISSDSLPADKVKVIVTFKNEINPQAVEKYGQVLKTIEIINGVVAIINRADIEVLKQEDSVKDVAVDMKGEVLPADGRLLNKEQRLHELQVQRKYIRVRQKSICTLISDLLSRLKKREIKGGEFVTLLKEGREKIDAEIGQLILLDTGIIVGWNLGALQGVGAENAWNTYSLNGSGVVIAILDSGVNYDLIDLTNVRVNDGEDINHNGVVDPSDFNSVDDDENGYVDDIRGWDFANDDNDPMDDNWDPSQFYYGHGTLVTTIAVGKGQEKIKGVAPNASYYPLKVFLSDGGGDASDIFDAINWCVNKANPKPDIISMSFGFDPNNPFWKSIEPTFRTAINNAYNAGIMLVAGSGNSSWTYSAYPAAFENVISVGGHDEDQKLYVKSNGGVDVVAPGKRVPSMDMTGDASYYYSGTSYATPHVSGLMALIIEYARQNNMTINNGYQFEVIKHSAKDMPLIIDPYPDDPDKTFKGKGKAWVADSIPPPIIIPPSPLLPWIPTDGSIDAMSEKWPLSYDIAYDNYLYLEEDLYPAYYIGTSMYYDVNLTNNTDTAGNYLSDIEDLNVTATQAYYQHQSETILPGSPICAFSTVSSLTAGSLEILSDTYYLPWAMVPGLNRTALDLEFEFADDTNNRLIKVSYPYAGLWCPPPAVNEGFPLE